MNPYESIWIHLNPFESNEHVLTTINQSVAEGSPPLIFSCGLAHATLGSHGSLFGRQERAPCGCQVGPRITRVGPGLVYNFNYGFKRGIWLEFLEVTKHNWGATLFQAFLFGGDLVGCGEPHGREMGGSPSIQIESWIQQQWAMLHDQKGVLTRKECDLPRTPAINYPRNIIPEKRCSFSCHKPLITEYHQMLLHNMYIYIYVLRCLDVFSNQQ